MTPTTAADAEETPVVKGLSILRLISTYPREQLFVHPLVWTTRHLDLLRCEFSNGGIISVASTPQEEPPNVGVIPTPATLPSPPDGAPADDYDTSELQRYRAYLNSEVFAAERLATSRDTISKQNALVRLLGGLKHRRMDRYRRNKLCGPPPPLGIPRRANPPVSRRTQKQLRRITPGNRYEDPYIAAVLIALTQEQRLREKGSDDNDETPQSAAASAAPLQMLLASGPHKVRWLHIYTSKISPEFLDMLNRPSLPPSVGAQPGPGMVIYRWQLAFKPRPEKGSTNRHRHVRKYHGAGGRGRACEGCTGYALPDVLGLDGQDYEIMDENRKEIEQDFHGLIDGTKRLGFAAKWKSALLGPTDLLRQARVGEEAKKKPGSA
ncbi:hypothetical protein OQA88_9169 [Cercophora sp. LCS_1]